MAEGERFGLVGNIYLSAAGVDVKHRVAASQELGFGRRSRIRPWLP